MFIFLARLNFRFVVFINVNVVDLNINIRLFADDASLYILFDTPQNTALQLNTDLAKIHIWTSV